MSPEEIRVVPEIAYDYGYYHGEARTDKKNVFKWQGKYVIVWEKIDTEMENIFRHMESK